MRLWEAGRPLGRSLAARHCRLRGLIGELKRRVEARFGLQLEEEVQYLGFEDGARSENPGKTQE